MYKISVIYKSRNFQLSGNLERMVNLVRGRECFSGLSILLVYTYRAHQYEGGGELCKNPGCATAKGVTFILQPPCLE